MFLRYVLRSLLARPATTAATVFGIALCTAALAAVLSFIVGIRAAVAGNGDATVGVFAAEHANELESVLSPDALTRLSAAPGVTDFSAELLLVLPNRLPNGDIVNLRIRGVDPVALALHAVRVKEGQPPPRGVKGALIGSSLVGRTPDLVVGGKLRLGSGAWPVIGVIEAPGRSFEAEIWVDRTALQHALGRQNASFAAARIDHAQWMAAADFARHLGNEAVVLHTESDFAKLTFAQIDSYFHLGDIIVIALALGALFAGASALDASYVARARELATLVTIGFTRRRVGAMLTTETVIVTMLGGGIGLFVAFLATNHAFDFEALSLTFRPQMNAFVVCAALGISALIGALASFLAIVQLFRMHLLQTLR